MKKVFFLKTNEDDRDCVKYMEVSLNFEDYFSCGHYFSALGLCGPCFSTRLDNCIFENEYFSILTEQEIKNLISYNEKINIDNLGCNIKKFDERYVKAEKYFNEIKHILEKLLSKQNEILFTTIKIQEKEYLKQEYNLTDRDIKKIFANSEYKDRGVVAYVYDTLSEYGRNCVDRIIDRLDDSICEYIDYKKYGASCLDDEYIFKISRGRILEINC